MRRHAFGRLPAGFRPSPGRADDELGRFFGEAAELEAASVHAFRILATELRALDAPDALIHAARHAAADEIRHARATTRLARRFGADPADVHISARPLRPLGEVALENAVEGCVGETWGALLADWQARSAGDPGIRATMAAIAPDENRHAELAWAVDAWVATQLRPDAYARVVAARRLAARSLRHEIVLGPPEILVERAGLPSAAEARSLYATVEPRWLA
jgi:hypothetical protein